MLVEVRLRKETPVKTDTRAQPRDEGHHRRRLHRAERRRPGGADPARGHAADKIPEIPSEKTGLKAMLDELPKLVAKFAAIEDQVKKVVTSVGGLTEKVKENPSLLLRRPEKSSSAGQRR